MRTPLSEKQALTDTLGRLAEDRFFARVAAADRRALKNTERRLTTPSEIIAQHLGSTGRQPEAASEGRATQSVIASGYRSRRRWARIEVAVAFVGAVLLVVVFIAHRT